LRERENERKKKYSERLENMVSEQEQGNEKWQAKESISDLLKSFTTSSRYGGARYEFDVQKVDIQGGI